MIGNLQTLYQTVIGALKLLWNTLQKWDGIVKYLRDRPAAEANKQVVVVAHRYRRGSSKVFSAQSGWDIA